MLDLVLKQSPEESGEPKTARVLLYKLFYDQTEEGMTHFLFNMIKSFDTHKQARRYSLYLIVVVFPKGFFVYFLFFAFSIPMELVEIFFLFPSFPPNF